MLHTALLVVDATALIGVGCVQLRSAWRCLRRTRENGIDAAPTWVLTRDAAVYTVGGCCFLIVAQALLNH